MAEVPGTAVADEQVDHASEVPAADVVDTTAAATGTTEQPNPAVESFINPSELPEEIKPHWKRMHSAYTKRLEKFNERKPDLDMLDRFRNDPSFARDLLQHEAQRLGFSLAPVNGTTPQTPPTAAARSGDGPPATLVNAIKGRLDPSLQWMAESLAAATWEGTRAATQPLVDRDRAKEQAARDTEWGAMSAKLTETAPGWEAHEDDMSELQDWLKGPSLTHPRFGDKLTFLYNAVTNGSQAKAAAIRSMGDAARNATRTGLSSRSTTPNITERVRKATTTQDAMKVAAEEAERELRAQGIAVPD
jgi:hypothetical protein